MPIRGITDLQGFAGANLPELGKLRKGGEKTERTNAEGKTYSVVGADLDYFRIDWHPQYESFDPIFKQLYGETPAEFKRVTLMGSTPEEAFPNWLEERTPTKLLHQCDGQTQNLHYDGELAAYSREPIPCVTASGGKCNCTERGKLKIILSDFVAASGVWGYFSVETGSLYDIMHIDSYLKFIAGFQGTLQGLYFILGRAPREISAPNPKKKGERIRTTKHLLYLMIEPEISKGIALANFHRQNQIMLEANISPDGVLQSHADPDALTDGKSLSKELPPPLSGQFNVDASPRLSYDLERVSDLTSHLFNDPSHQLNLIVKLQNDGAIHNGMTDDEVVETIKANRRSREMEQYSDGSFWTSEVLVKQFLSEVSLVTGLLPNQINEALNTQYIKDPKVRWSQFKGLNRADAYALCLIYANNGDWDKAKYQGRDDLDIIQSINYYQTKADIPF